MALVGNMLYVANTDAVMKFPYQRRRYAHHGRRHGARRTARRADQPPLDQEPHRQPDGSKLYVHVGSNSNVGERGMPAEEGAPRSGKSTREPAPPRLRLGPAQSERHGLGAATGALWTVVNERDEIGSDLVPDYMTSVKDGGFYGWPYSYYGQHVDERVQAADPDWWPRRSARLRARPHTASLGLTHSRATCPRRSRMACSSANTARGTASRTVATR
jgi:glucose/arabinose dehydrogenase